jgi:hypothetical protein
VELLNEKHTEFLHFVSNRPTTSKGHSHQKQPPGNCQEDHNSHVFWSRRGYHHPSSCYSPVGNKEPTLDKFIQLFGIVLLF